MNNFQQRALSGIVYVLILCLGIFINELTAHGLMISLSLLAVREYLAIAKDKFNYKKPFTTTIILLLIYSYFNIDFVNTYFTVKQNQIGISIILFLYIEWMILLFKTKTKNPTHFLTNIFGYLYTVIPFALAVPFAKLFSSDYNGIYLFLLFLFIWSSDSFAYLVGRKIGKTKLFKEVSPKKSWEGFIGGLVITTVIGFSIGLISPKFSSLLFGIMAFVVFIVGSIGDLFQSSFKRSLEIKDSSNLIPGHGGILDRLDSFIFVIPFIYFLFQLFI